MLFFYSTQLSRK